MRITCLEWLFLAAVAFLLLLTLSGCGETPQPPHVTAKVSVGDSGSTIEVSYIPAAEGDAMQANSLNYALVTAMNSGLHVVNVQHEEVARDAQAEQTVVIGVLTLVGITIICGTYLCKGKV